MIFAVVETWSTQSGWIKFTEHKPSVWGFQTKHRPESRTKLKATAQAARTKGWWYILVWPTNINSEQKRAGNLEMIVFFSGKIHRYFHGGWTIFTRTVKINSKLRLWTIDLTIFWQHDLVKTSGAKHHLRSRLVSPVPGIRGDACAGII